MNPSALEAIRTLTGGNPPWEAGPLAGCLDRLHQAATTSQRTDAWITLVRWTRRQGGRLSSPAPGVPVPWQRLDFLLRLLESDPALREAHRRCVREILDQARATDLFADCGIPSDRGTLAEVTEGIMRRLLPQPRDDHDLASLLRRLFPTTAQARRFEQLPPEYFDRMAALITPHGTDSRSRPFHNAIGEAFTILAVRVQAQLLGESVRSRLPDLGITHHPALALAETSATLTGFWRQGKSCAEAAAAWRTATGGVRQCLDRAAATQEDSGVNVDLIHTLETARQCLRRMETLLGVMTAEDSTTARRRTHALLAELIAANLEGRHPLKILSSRTALLHRKIVERAGQTGSHYIARNLQEYAWIWKAAAGGGLLTVGTAAVKLGLHELHGLPLFVAGLAAGLNYAVSFMLLHHAHLILATKQPAMTAAHLARFIRELSGSRREQEIAAYTARICHSQLAAATANVTAVAIGSILLVLLWHAVTGHGLIPESSAHHTLHSLSPLDSGTVFFAAWTGVLLWAASMIGGWVDNWAACHRLADGLAALPPLPGLPRARWRMIGSAVRTHTGAWATNISLGFLLGLSPSLGGFLGIPLEVRHVTLSTGQLALASASLGHHWLADGFFFRALGGIGVMFVLNLSVSFLCALFTAARAYQLSARETAAVLIGIARYGLAHPLDFIFPPRPGSPASQSP